MQMLREGALEAELLKFLRGPIIPFMSAVGDTFTATDIFIEAAEGASG